MTTAEKLIKITADGSITKRILKAGTGATPVAKNIVEVHYTGYLPNGDQFDSSESTGYPFQFPLGEGKVIKGWDLALPTFTKGERAELIIAPEYAYGEEGSGDIPPNTQLRFVVELLDFKSTGGRSTKAVENDMERLAAIRKEREEAQKKREADKAAKEKATAEAKAAEPETKAAGAKGGKGGHGHGGHKKH